MTQRNRGYIYKRRLLALAAFLESLPPERFDYGTWADDRKKGSLCGTTACALGWACSMPAFRRQGLRLVWYGVFGDAYPSDTVTGESGTGAACRVFGLSDAEAAYLFLPEHNPKWTITNLPGLKRAPAPSASAKDVAKHIRAFVEAKYPDKPSNPKAARS